jgi:hypothetical protein
MQQHGVRPIGSTMVEDAKEEIMATSRTQEDQLLIKLVEMPDASQAKLATALGWNMRGGKPNKMLVSRKLEAMVRAKLIKKERDGYTLTSAGEKAVAKLRPKQTDQPEG